MSVSEKNRSYSTNEDLCKFDEDRVWDNVQRIIKDWDAARYHNAYVLDPTERYQRTISNTKTLIDSLVLEIQTLININKMLREEWWHERNKNLLSEYQQGKVISKPSEEVLNTLALKEIFDSDFKG